MPEWLRRLAGIKSKEQTSDEVAKEILAQAKTRDMYSGRPQDPPLIDEHPGYYLTFGLAQPGGILTKIMAPFAYKGIANGIQNGENVLELMAPGFKKMQSFEELGSIRDGLARSISGEVKATKNGRVAFDTKKVQTGPKRYVRTGTSKQKATYQTPSSEVLGENTPASISERTTAYMRALNQATEAAEMGYDSLSEQFYQYASKLNPQKDAFKSRFLWGKLYKNGGVVSAKSGIHIKKENRGKFTKSAKAAGHSVQEHARAVLNNPNATPLQKKRANFARNAAKWHHKRRKHKFGGTIIPNWIYNILGGE